MTAPPRLEPGAVFADDFVIERRLAEGGMGAVYVVEQRSTGHRRALKVLHPDVVADPRNRERFAQEARVGARIGSPHVVEVTAAGVEEATDTPWLLMELLEGEDLAARIARGALPERAVLREMFEQLGDALGRAHAVGVVHRDLKPENLFIATSRLRGVPFIMKVLDFGVATVVSEQKRSATVTTAIGSPLWMAPEQANVGAQVGAPADVWALGLIAFYALTGRYFWPSLEGPKESFSLTPLLVDIAVNPIPTASARAAAMGVGDRLPAGFDAWLQRCVTRDPAQRFPDARAAVDALLPLLSDAPARPANDLALGATLLALPSPPGATTSAPLSAPAAPSRPPPGASRRPLALAAAALVTLAGAGAALALRGAGTTTPPGAPARPPSVVTRVDAAVTPAADVAVTAAADVAAVAPPDVVANVAGDGRLEVSCSRRCRVTVDGVERGSARRPIALAAGEHAVVATRGETSLTRTVRVAAGETARVSFDFDGEAREEAPASSASPANLPVAPDASAQLPDRPSRAAVEAAFQGVAEAARGCGARGRVFVLATFAGDGSVTSASVEGEHARTPAGECIARAARRARVPPFRRTSILVSQALDL